MFWRFSRAHSPTVLEQTTFIIYHPETLEVAGIRDRLEVGSQVEAGILELEMSQ